MINNSNNIDNNDNDNDKHYKQRQILEMGIGKSLNVSELSKRRLFEMIV